MKTMMKLTLAVLIGGMGLHTALAGGALEAPARELGMSEVIIQVDGLSCPFCAYGLEKKLRKVENVAKLEIKVDEGRAVIHPEPGTSLDLEALEKAVRDGGFTPREVTLTARGRLTELSGAPALELSNGILLLLAEDAQTTALLKSQGAKLAGGAGPVVQVKGQAARQQGKGHAGHPYTLTVRTFEVA